jgi:hypothetical protein
LKKIEAVPSPTIGGVSSRRAHSRLEQRCLLGAKQNHQMRVDNGQSTLSKLG